MKALKVAIGWIGSLAGVFAVFGAFVWLLRKISVLFRAIH